MKRKFGLQKDNIAKLKTGRQPLHVVKVKKKNRENLPLMLARKWRKKGQMKLNIFGDRLPARPQRQVKLSKYMN